MPWILIGMSPMVLASVGFCFPTILSVLTLHFKPPRALDVTILEYVLLHFVVANMKGVKQTGHQWE